MSLTRGGAILLLMLAFALIVAGAGSPTAFMAICLFTSLLIINLPLARASCRHSDVTRKHSTHVMEHSTFRVSLQVTRRHPGVGTLLQIADSGPTPVTRSPLFVPLLQSGGDVTLEYDACMRRRGVYDFTTASIQSTAPFGLARATRRVNAVSHLTVYPAYYDLSGTIFPFHKTHSGLASAPGARAGEGPDFFGLRQYRPGDAIRKIHWPSTVRAGEVMVKEFEEDMHSFVTVILDTRTHSHPHRHLDAPLDVAVRVAASLVNHALANGHPASLTFYDAASAAPQSVRTQGDLTVVLESLARLTSSTVPTEQLLHHLLPTASPRSNWLVVLLNTDPQTLNAVLAARAKGAEVSLVVVGPEPGPTADNAGFFDAFSQAGIAVAGLRPDQDIQATLCRDFSTRGS